MRRELWWVLIALVCIGMSVWLYFSLERYTTEIYRAQSREAIKNPFLAAQRYLSKRGVRVIEQAERLDFDLIPHDHVVVLAQVDALLVSDSQIQKAVSWVKNGGFLVLGVKDEVEGHSSILKHYGIEVEKKSSNLADVLVGEDGEALNEQETEREINRRLNQPSDEQRAEQDDGARLVAEDDTVRSILRLLDLEFEHSFYPMKLTDLEDTLYVAVLDRIVLDHSYGYDDDYSDDEYSDEEYNEDNEVSEPYNQGARATISKSQQNGLNDAQSNHGIEDEIWDEHGTRLLQIKDELGTVTILSSTAMWQNKNIGLGDHARLLSHFVSDNSNVHFVFNVQAPTLTELAKRYSFEAVFALCLLVFFWLWRVATRVTKQTEMQPRLGRDFGEHLKAGAKFMAMHQQYKPILDSLNDDIELEMRRYHFGFSGFSSIEKADLIHQQTSLAKDVYMQWTELRDSPENEYEFVQALQLGQTIRKKL